MTTYLGSHRFFGGSPPIKLSLENIHRYVHNPTDTYTIYLHQPETFEYDQYFYITATGLRLWNPDYIYHGVLIVGIKQNDNFILRNGMPSDLDVFHHWEI